MIHLIQTKTDKPDRIATPEASKGDDYHMKYSRWVLGNTSGHHWTNFVNKYNLNMSFYKNNQWILDEDTEAFFMDDSGQDRHRIKVTKNYIQPMVEQYRGNAERMRFDFRIFNLSPSAQSKRDKQLARVLNYHMVGDDIPSFKQYMRNNGAPIGNTKAETETRFDNSYTDEYVVSGNSLIRSVSEMNKLMDMRMRWALDMALGGVAVAYPYPHGGDWRIRRVSPKQWGFDITAQSDTLDDAEFFWEYSLMSPSTIFEQWSELGELNRTRIESYVSQFAASQFTGESHTQSAPSGKVPVYTSVWRDILADDFAYVRDEYGQVVLSRINYIEPDQENPKYTDEDAIPVDSLNTYQRRVMRGKTIRKLYVDNWRYCVSIPHEVIGGDTRDLTSKDIVLECGSLPYQEPNLYRSTNMLPPYKVGLWSYLDGEILSPIDVAINPQRMVNRFMSVMENMLNNATGAGTVYDKDVLGQDDEDEFLAKMNRNESVGIHARGRGVQNYIGKYDGMPRESLIAFTGLMDAMKRDMEDVTGVNEGLKGQTDNPDQLVGVMQLMIQRGSIIQEPFYKALSDLYKGCYQSIVTAGKRFYIDNDLDLEDFTGERGARVLKLSKDMRNISLRVDLERSMDTQTERVYTDSQVTMWLQYGLIDQPTAGSLIGRSTYTEAVMAMRDYQKGLMIRQRDAQAQNQMANGLVGNANQQMQRVAYGEKLREETREEIESQKDRDSKERIAEMKK